MYSRKLKALKKKSKSGIKANDVGSSWGPRLALYEREREQAKEPKKQQQIYPSNNNHNHQIPSSSSSGVSSSATHHYGHHQQQQMNPRRQHHHHLDAHNDDGIPPPPRATSSASGHNASNSHHGKMTSGSSDITATCSSTSGRLSSAGVGGGAEVGKGQNNGNLSKPLSVIIPPPPPSEHFLILPSSDFGPDHDDSLPSTKTWRSSSPEKQIPDLTGKAGGSDKNKTVEVQVHTSSPSNHNASNTKPISGLLAPSETKLKETSEKKVIHTKLVHVEIEKGIQLRDLQENEEEIDLRKSPSATVAALKQGLAMIYVPMEQAARRKRSVNSPEEIVTASVEEILEHNHVSGTSSAQSTPKSEKQKDSRKSATPPNETPKDNADGDSLLESFDSIIFKPRSLSTAAPSSGTASNSSSHSSPTCAHPSTSRKNSSPVNRSEPTAERSSPALDHHYHHRQQTRTPESSSTPPPLPPLNENMNMMILKPTKRTDKNLRFSEESIQMKSSTTGNNHASRPLLGKKVPIPTAPHTQLTSQNSQKDAQSEVTEVTKDMKQYPATCHSSSAASRDDSTMTVLSCGHVKTTSNYSTLSSITSSLTDDEQQLGNNNNNSPTRDTRSAIQQLRDLSLLIGGNFHNNNTDDTIEKEQDQQRTKSSNNHKGIISNNNNKSKRRDSQESAVSGTDSGKGSGGSGQSPMMLETNSPKEKIKQLIGMVANNPTSAGYPLSSTCVFGNGDCDDCFMVFRNPLASSSSDSSHRSSGTSPLLSCNPRISGNSGANHEQQQRRHHHLIIQEQNSSSSKLLKQSVGKKSGSHASISSSSHHSTSSTSKKSKKSSKKHKKTHELVFEYCDCRHCDCRGGGSASVKPQIELNGKNHQISLTPSMNFNGNRDSPTNSSVDLHQNNNLFTIDEEEIADVLEFNARNQTQNFMDVTIKDFNTQEGKDPHWHPKCWLAPDPTMGWSDLESLYSQNMKLDKPLNINDECWTCWREVAEHKRLTGTDSNRTIDRTKRMFIWLNKRHKEFNAPWWEAKKQASIRWLITKAFAHLPKEAIGDPFKESKKGKPKYRLKDEAIKGLVNGNLYCLVLDHLYQNQHYRTRGLTHWDIIKILSRRGVYVAQPSDMKLTEGTLRQRKPLRIAAHIALIEAIMSLYCKETLSRDRVIATLNSFGQTVDPDVSTAEELLIAWINSAMLTLKSYILSNNNKSQKLPCGRLNRWLNVPQVQEIRDLCDGIGICSLFALYCSSDLQVSEIAVPEPNDVLNIYETIANHAIIERLCHELFPEKIYHLRITDFLYIHGYMKQNILSFLVDLFHHLEINPIIRVNRLTHVPVRLELQ